MGSYKTGVATNFLLTCAYENIKRQEDITIMVQCCNIRGHGNDFKAVHLIITSSGHTPFRARSEQQCYIANFSGLSESSKVGY